jgi:hypothetical protein
MEIEDGRFHLAAEDASARAILTALGGAVGAEVVCPAGWDSTVTLRMRDAPLESVIRAVAGNWALLEEEGTGTGGGRRIVVMAEADGAVEDAARLYRRAFELFESPTPDEMRLMQRILQRGWTDEGRALNRLFTANADALTAFRGALSATEARFDWDRLDSARENVNRGREMVEVYLVSRLAGLADGDPGVISEIAQTVKFAADVGRGGPLEAKMAEDAFRRKILAVLDRSASSAQAPPAVLRASLRSLDRYGPDPDEMSAALASAWPQGRIMSREPDGAVEIGVGRLASMPLRSFAPMFTAAVRGEVEIVGIERSDLTTLRRVLEMRAQVTRQSSATQMRVAALTHEAERGAMPEGVDQLVPGYLASVPQDAYTGRQVEGVTFAGDGRPIVPRYSFHAARDVLRPRGLTIPPDSDETGYEHRVPTEVIPPTQATEGMETEAGDQIGAGE